MDYEKKYNEILAWVKKYKARLNGVPIEEIFPELRESEDERIRKAIKEAVDVYWSDDKQARLDIYSYLEKQKEQKPAEWSEKDEENFKWFDKLFRAESIVVGGRDIPQDKYLWFKSLRPQPKREWSEEDEKKIERLRSIVNDCAFRNDALDVNGDYCEGDYEELDSWLKSLRPRPNWKPSEEQMRAVFDASKRNDGLGSVLRNLYNDLKKL